MKKTILALLLALTFVFSFAACTPEIIINTNGTGNGQSETQNSTPSTTEDQGESATGAADTKTDAVNDSSSVSSDKTDNSKASEASKAESSSKSSKSDSTQSNSTSSQISKSKAKSIAFDHAGVKEADVRDLEVELDRDGGVQKYEISFDYNGLDYEYEINAKTGKIISPKNSIKISKSKAKSTALNHAGVKEADIRDYEIELDDDDDRIWKYDVSFNSGNTEYEYKINAETGKIISSNKEIDD